MTYLMIPIIDHVRDDVGLVNVGVPLLTAFSLVGSPPLAVGGLLLLVLVVRVVVTGLMTGFSQSVYQSWRLSFSCGESALSPMKYCAAGVRFLLFSLLSSLVNGSNKWPDECRISGTVPKTGEVSDGLSGSRHMDALLADSHLLDSRWGVEDPGTTYD